MAGRSFAANCGEAVLDRPHRSDPAAGPRKLVLARDAGRCRPGASSRLVGLR